MGFFDSMKGFVSGLTDIVSGVIQSPVGQVFAQAGAQSLFGKLFPTQTFPGGFQPQQQQFPGQFQQFPQQFLPQQFPQLPPPLPVAQTRNFIPGVQFPQSGQFTDFRAPAPTPFGGAMSAFPTDRFVGGVIPAEFGIDLPGFDLRSPFVAQGAGGNTCAAMFRPTASSVRPNSLVMVPNPVTGAPTFFKHAGKPLLFAGDLRAAKMVNKLARRARRASPRR